MKELKQTQISSGGRFDSIFEVWRIVQIELNNDYFLNLSFSVLHQESGRGRLSDDLKNKAKAVAIDMQQRGFPHPFYSPKVLEELVRKD